ncbi:GNAT family N-acetyltransferase [Massilia horti]|uniref:GNAT family N-acetyltransferase n=2 Tax=Massilia horti TaxID=2562153 RepID=A0A4Y9SUA4_9BURK|nr:GNAT family N-acetyltransferase [Massilia horti]
MSRSDSRLPEDKRAAFSLGLATPLDRPGWRRVWIALDAAGSIAGHVDLRARPEAAAAHRALLGMGVHRDWRRQGVGSRLIETAIAWGRTEAGLGWIDLEVLSANEPAVALYLRHGFGKIGEYRQMFRIDGATLDYTLMALAL